MPFVNARYHPQHQFDNNTEFISPPTTPKLHLESTFNTIGPLVEEDCWGSVSSIAPSSPSSCYSPTMSDAPAQIKPKLKNAAASIPSRRFKRKPLQSLPITTKGTFYMPILIKDTPKLQSKIKKRKHTKAKNHTIIPKETLLANIKHTNDHNNNQTIENDANLSPMPINLPILPQTPSVTPNQTDNNTLIAAEEEEQTIKKAKTDAAFLYDSLTADCDQAVLFLNKEEWIPSLEVFNRRPTVRISWKGSPLKIRNMPYFDRLHPGEVSIAATLRLTPEQYLKCKWALVLAAKEAFETNSLFRKSEAQKVCCIDVNKTSVLWNAFGKLGWLGSNWPQ